MTDERAIGIFDSGLGGLTTVRRMHEIMPQEHLVYFGDTGRVPYGTRSAETIIKYARQDMRFLYEHNLKAMIVACGTVSSVAMHTVASEFADVPIFGVVEPACIRALAHTRNGRIGVIGTAGTIRSQAYETLLRQKQQAIHVVAQACPLFVPLVENGRVHTGDVVIETIAREYLTPLRQQGIDTLILGCTHFPLLSTVIAQVMGPQVTLIDAGAAVADFVKTQIAPATGTGKTEYFVSDDPAPFAGYASMFLQGQPVGQATQIDIAAYDSP